MARHEGWALPGSHTLSLRSKALTSLHPVSSSSPQGSINHHVFIHLPYSCGVMPPTPPFSCAWHQPRMDYTLNKHSSGESMNMSVMVAKSGLSRGKLCTAGEENRTSPESTLTREVSFITDSGERC